MSRTALSRARLSLNRPLLVLAQLLALGACANTENRPQVDAELAALREELSRVNTTLADTRAELERRDISARAEGSALAENLATLRTDLTALPAALAALCPAAPANPVATDCKREVEIRTVSVGGDKLVVGELERIVIDPPGGTLVARIDTGADSSSLHAEELVEFERDGKRWVRFNLRLEDGVATIERPIRRVARVRQQDDDEARKRPVVQLRIRLGKLRQTVDFTLADRSHMDNEVLLGRNFLTDAALVDVGQQFLQTTRRNGAPNAGANDQARER
ncbi:MAG: ATP-dependent zinc protease [Pseudomonadales bacterium]|jgi:hypothetical protein